MKKEELINRYVKGEYDFQGVGLRGADLTYTRIKGANLRGADLSGATLWGADLDFSVFVGANLWLANLTRANLIGANLAGADLESANLAGANLVGASLAGADLKCANLRGANLERCTGNGQEIKTIQTDPWTVTYTADVMQIGCQRYLITEWWGLDDDQIGRMDSGALEWWRKWKPILQQIISVSPATPTGHEGTK